MPPGSTSTRPFYNNNRAILVRSNHSAKTHNWSIHVDTCPVLSFASWAIFQSRVFNIIVKDTTNSFEDLLPGCFKVRSIFQHDDTLPYIHVRGDFSISAHALCLTTAVLLCTFPCHSALHANSAHKMIPPVDADTGTARTSFSSVSP